MKQGLFIIIILLTTFLSSAQQKHTISGAVTDQQTGETLIGATIRLLGNSGIGVLSNSYGFYSITAPENKYVMVVSFSGYQSDTLEISLTKDITHQFALEPAGAELNEVVVVARRNDNITRTLPGVQKISIEEIKNVPVIFGEQDILKTIQLLPGIKSGGDGSTGFFVRGGGADQNLILLDEATVYNASHLLGFFSTFN